MEKNIESFNKWYKEFYNAGTFGRTDKLSPSVIIKFFDFLKIQYTEKDRILFQNEITQSWLKRNRISRD
jgi:hypothetical protein